MRSTLAQNLRVAFHPDVRIHARVWMKATCLGTRAAENGQRRNANGKANCRILRRAKRKPPGPSVGRSQTAEPSDGRIANCWAPGWADRKPLGCRMGQTQTGASSDGRNANRWAPGWSKRKPWDVHKGGTQTAEPGANSQTQTQTTTHRKPERKPAAPGRKRQRKLRAALL